MVKVAASSLGVGSNQETTSLHAGVKANPNSFVK